MICDQHRCKMHPTDCYRCGGNGYTEADIEAMENPLEWHSTGDCYACRGTGITPYPVCEECEMDAAYELSDL